MKSDAGLSVISVRAHSILGEIYPSMNLISFKDDVVKGETDTTGTGMFRYGP